MSCLAVDLTVYAQFSFSMDQRFCVPVWCTANLGRPEPCPCSVSLVSSDTDNCHHHLSSISGWCLYKSYRHCRLVYFL